MASRAFLGGGDLYIDRYDPATGLKLGRAGPFECSKFEVKANTEVKEAVSKGRSTYGQVIETVAIQKPADVSVTLTEMDKDGLTLALLGTQAVVSQGAGTITDEQVSLSAAKMDKWLPLTQAEPQPGRLRRHQQRRLGDLRRRHRLPGQSPPRHDQGARRRQHPKHRDDQGHAGYSAYDGTMIAGATQAQVRAEFVLDGVNFADNLPVICTAHEVVLAPDSAFDFLSDGFGEITLKGRAKTPVGKTEPFTVELRTA